MDTDPLKAAMLALRKPPDQAQAPSKTPPGFIGPGFIGPGFSAGGKPQPQPEPKSKLKAKAKPKPKPAPLPVALAPELVNDCENGILECKNGIEDMPEINIKDHLTEKEARFIDLWLRGDLNVDRAMEAAGYKGFHQKTLYRIGKKIVEKYESSAGEHRKIMRAMGYGETTAIANLIDSATNAKSEIVRLTARTTLAKCLGLFSDAVTVNQGIQIIIKGREDHSGRPAAQVLREAPKVPPRAMAILK